MNKSLEDARIRVEEGSLVIANSRIRRTVALTGNVLSTLSLQNVATGREWSRPDGSYIPRLQRDMAIAEGQAPTRHVRQQAALFFAGNEDFIRQFTSPAQVAIEHREGRPFEAASLVAHVTLQGAEMRVIRHYQIYPGCPAIACWTDVRGRCVRGPVRAETVDARGRGVRPGSRPRRTPNADIHDALFLQAQHLRIRNVEFTDCSDYVDNYVQEQERYTYPTFEPWVLDGQLLFAEDLRNGEGLFMAKESPVLCDQPDQPDGDFLYAFDRGCLGPIGWGITPEDLQEGENVSSWRTVIGVYDGSDASGAEAVKHYLARRSRETPGRDWVVMANQWGDSRSGKQLDEAFVRAEIDACAEVGIPAYMLDAGWQAGRFEQVLDVDASGKSVFYDLSRYWEVDRRKFPQGLRPIADYARCRGVELMLWFNPDPLDENRNADRDAETLLALHRELGVRVFKIDGVWNLTGRAERNNRRFLERVVRESGGAVGFQLDITNGARWGFLGAIDLGILFVENRYATFATYFPYKVHKNLWELARYLRPQRLQFEFINNRAEQGLKYRPQFAEEDPLTPESFDIAYCFAAVMFANPLAWLEPSALNEQQRAQLAPLLTAYQRVRDAIFAGDIYPIGEKPSGRSITGFQSHNPSTGSGVVCVYREATERTESVLALRRLSPGARLRFQRLYGEGEADYGPGGLRVRLPRQRSFVLLQYTDVLPRRLLGELGVPVEKADGLRDPANSASGRR